MVAQEYLLKAALKERGWTDSLIERFLPQPDRVKPNPHGRRSPPMKLYERGRVEQVEGSAEFAEAVSRGAGRREAAKKATETRRKALAEEAAADATLTHKEATTRLLDLMGVGHLAQTEGKQKEWSKKMRRAIRATNRVAKGET